MLERRFSQGTGTWTMKLVLTLALGFGCGGGREMAPAEPTASPRQAAHSTAPTPSSPVDRPSDDDAATSALPWNDGACPLCEERRRDCTDRGRDDCGILWSRCRRLCLDADAARGQPDRSAGRLAPLLGALRDATSLCAPGPSFDGRPTRRLGRCICERICRVPEQAEPSADGSTTTVRWPFLDRDGLEITVSPEGALEACRFHYAGQVDVSVDCAELPQAL